MKATKIVGTAVVALALLYLVVTTFLPDYMIVGVKIPKLWGR
jgi:hypothetical protein